MREIDISNVVVETNFSYLLYKRGKVRDTYDLGDRLRMVSTDRISAFDVVLPNGIPYKGEVLNMLSVWWSGGTSHIIPNHIIEQVNRRTVDVKKARVLPIEWVVRGYLASGGSLWNAYINGESYCGITLPPGLQKADKLPYPILTPTTKAETGHDMPLRIEEVADILSNFLHCSKSEAEVLTERLRNDCVNVYQFACDRAEQSGIICADTKFEIGLLPDGTPILVDELLTPDSSRWWSKEDYSPGKDQKSYDKQPVRDWLVDIAKWKKQPPAPRLPDEVVIATSRRYQEGYERLTGLEF